MKIRNGFVSNSSSSSFCIVGKQYDGEDVKKILEEKNISADDIIGDFYISGDELIRKVAGEDSTLDYYSYCDYSSIVLGYEIDKMKDDETLGDFKKRALDEIKKIDKDCTYVSILYDGEFNG